MPRCNLTLKQKCQIIELSKDYTSDQLAKKFHVHPTTVTRTIQKKARIMDQASRVNINFKTVQTNHRNEEHDSLVLEYIKSRQNANEPITIKEICDKAVECAGSLGRDLHSKRGWWRRFKVRCNIVRSRFPKSSIYMADLTTKKNKLGRPSKASGERNKTKNYTYKIRDSCGSQMIKGISSSTRNLSPNQESQEQ